MRRWTVDSMQPTSGVVRLLVALSVLPLVCDSAQVVYQKEGCFYTDNNVTHLESHDPRPNAVPPVWWTPMFCPIESGRGSGHMCGVATRIFDGSRFLAHKRTIKRITELSEALRWNLGKFWFKPNITADLTWYLLQDEAYYPEHQRDFLEDFALYRVEPLPRRPFHPRQKVPPLKVEPAHLKYPIGRTRLRLESNKNFESKDCYLLTYGTSYHSHGVPFPKGARKLKKIAVRQLDPNCTGPICSMTTESDGDRPGFLCGAYTNLGNPIFCGQKPRVRITYMVADYKTEQGAGICTRSFRALKVAHICKMDPTLSAITNFPLLKCGLE